MTSLLALFIAVPALADHPYFGRSSFGVRGRVAAYGGKGHFGHRPPRYACSSQLEYQRGYEHGHRRGFKVGYRHGFNGRRFCGTPVRDLARESRYFVKGYVQAYGRAYEQGFRRGRADCGTPAHDRHGR